MKPIYIRAIKEATILLLYSIVFFILTYPLLLHFSSGIAGRFTGDGHLFIWNAWEFIHQFGQGVFPVTTNHILYPNVLPLSLHTFTVVNSLLIYLINFFTSNLVFSFNLVYLLSSIASAYFAYRFFYLLSSNQTASIIGGQLFAFQQLWSIYAIFGTQNLLTMWFVPAVFFFLELSLRGKTRYAFISGLVLGLALINDFYPFIFAISGVTVYLILRCLFIQRDIKKIFVCASLASIGFFSIAWVRLTTIVTQSAFIRSVPLPTLADVDFYHADPINLLRPSAFHPLWGSLNALFTSSASESGNSFIGFTGLFVIVLSIVLMILFRKIVSGKKYLLLFFLGFTVFVSLSLGPYLHIAGYATGKPMPHYFIQLLFKQFNNIRSPRRWLIIAEFFKAGVFVWLLRYIFDILGKKKKYVLAVILSIGFVVDVAYIPREIIPIYGKETSLLETIKPSSLPGTVAYVPFGVGSGYFNVGTNYYPDMSRQVVHERAIIDGHLSRLPEEFRDYDKKPVIKYFANYLGSPPDAEDLSTQNIDEFFRTYALRFLVIDKLRASINSEPFQAFKSYVKNSLHFRLTQEDEYLMIYSQEL